MNKYFFTAVLAFLLFFLIFLFLESRPSIENHAAASAPLEKHENMGDASTPIQTDVKIPIESPEQNQIETLGKIRENLLLGLNSSGSYRALYEEALKNPEAGGIFYATRILSRCMRALNFTSFGKQTQTPYSPTMDNKKYLEMSNAADELRRKCSEFTPDELSEENGLRILQSSSARDDPLILAMSSLGSNYDFDNMDKLRDQINEIIRLGDPFLIDDAGKRLALTRNPKNGQFEYLFAGNFYSSNSEANAGYALYLLPCGLGMQCNKNEFEIAIKCASSGECYNGREDYIKAMMISKPKEYERTMHLYDQMVKTIKTGSENMFLN